MATNVLQGIQEMTLSQMRSFVRLLPAYQKGRRDALRTAFFERIVELCQRGAVAAKAESLEDSMEAILEMNGEDRFAYAVRLLGFAEGGRAHKLYTRLIEKMQFEKDSEETGSLLNLRQLVYSPFSMY